MLVIRRRAGESLLVGDNVEIEILEISGGQVKLGIRAPREVSILRKEVYLTREQNRAAVESARSPRVRRWIDQLAATTNTLKMAPSILPDSPGGQLGGAHGDKVREAGES